MVVPDREALLQVFVDSAEFNLSPRSAKRLWPTSTETGGNDGARARSKFLLIGNCQIGSISRCIQALTGDVLPDLLELTDRTLRQIGDKTLDLSSVIKNHEVIIIQAPFVELMLNLYPQMREKIVVVPVIVFSGYHPDLVYVGQGDKRIVGPLGDYHSSIALYGYLANLSVAETRLLFCGEIFEHLGFFDHWDAAKAWLLQESTNSTRSGLLGGPQAFPVDVWFDAWVRRGCFMHSINHPKVSVAADLARGILAALKIDGARGSPEAFAYDDLADQPTWPVYPEIAGRHGIPGDYQFKLAAQPNKPVRFLPLEEFIERSFEAYRKVDREALVCERLDATPYKELEALLRKRAKKALERAAPPATVATPSANSVHPYRNLPSFHFWRRSIENVPAENVDPVVKGAFRIAPEDKVATAGSCFSQEISRMLRFHRLNYYICEAAPPHMSESDAFHHNYGIFSARYGNIYTARQLLQLFDRCYDKFHSIDRAWRRADGRYVDPFRPQIEPDGFASLELLDAARAAHLASVKTMFETLDVFVFTLGLTECWRSKSDGAVFPLAPGVVADQISDEDVEFINFTVGEVVADMQRFLDSLFEVNKRAKVILTVSPVPIIATYENHHVLVSNTYTKSALRAAAHEITRSRDRRCVYFPSYELIVGNFHRGRYVKADLRSVSDEGLDHVMRLFLHHYYEYVPQDERGELAFLEAGKLAKIVCDEERIGEE
jgi:hypothetical protein